MGQLCCFPFARAEEKLNLTQTARRVSRTSARKPADEEELARVSRRVVDEAVQRAMQQYLEETQQQQHSNGDAPPPKEASSPNANTNTPNTTTTTMPSPTSPTATQQQQQPPTINVNANK